MNHSVIIVIALAVAVLLAGCGGKTTAADLPATGAITAPDYTDEIRGRIAVAENGSVILLSESSGPIVLGGEMNFEGLQTGDDLTIYCDGVTESYPCGAVVKEMTLHGHGDISDLSAEQLDTLTALGFNIQH